MKEAGTGKGRTVLLLALVAILAPGLAIVIGEIGLGKTLERRVYDLWFEVRDPRPAPDEIVVVTIDEDSEDALGRWPWSREWDAHLVRNLHRAGARVVAFDVTFPGASPVPAHDSVFRRVMDSTGIVVLGAKEDARVGRTGRTRRLEEPTPLLADGAALGIVDIYPDRFDAVVREYPFFTTFLRGENGQLGEVAFAQLGIQALLRYLDLPMDALEPMPDGWRLGDREIPRGPEGGMLIDYLGPRGSVTTRSFVDIVDDADTRVGWDMDEFEFLLEEGLLEDRIVLVGSTIPEHQDFHPTPFSRVAGPTSGVEIHAHAVATILAGNHIRRASWPVEWGWAFLLGLSVVALSPKLRTLWGGALAGGLAVGTLVLSWQLFSQAGLWFWAVGPLLSLGLSYSGSSAALYVLEEREKARIRGMFSQYVASSVVDELIENPALLSLGGEERVLTVLFSDVADFSTISERLTPTELVELLNEYLTAMSEIVMGHGGIIDKYQGDALMAEFGAPVPMDDHALRACWAALEMQEELIRLRRKWAEEGKPRLVARSGINTGPMLVGNLGSHRIMDYTVMGDHVNLASRLEGANKAYGTHLMISEFTWSEVRDHVVWRDLDRIRVKGKEEPVGIYEVLATREEGVGPETEQLLGEFHRALARYRGWRFEEALEAFHRLEETHPTDGPVRLYVGRCREYLAEPPPADWDGVYTMTTK